MTLKDSLTNIWNSLQEKMMVAELWKSQEMQAELEKEGYSFFETTVAPIAVGYPIASPVTVKIPFNAEGEKVYSSADLMKKYRQARKKAARKILGL